MRQNNEYILCRQISTYLKLQYPKILFHWDLSGLNHSKAQAGMAKAIQYGRGWPDLFIAEARGDYHGLFIEVKADGVNIFQRDGETYATLHYEEQSIMIDNLRKRRYAAFFCKGFDHCKMIIDSYLK